MAARDSLQSRQFGPADAARVGAFEGTRANTYRGRMAAVTAITSSKAYPHVLTPDQSSSLLESLAPGAFSAKSRNRGMN